MAKPVVNLPGEIWKPVVGYEGLYEVSNLGRVKSCKRRVPHPNKWGNAGSERVVRARVRKPKARRKGGYLDIGLHRHGKVVTALVHRLVLEAFVGPCPEGMECCHSDGDPANNNVSNLRWDTRIANHEDRFQHGTMPLGTAHANAKLTPHAVRQIRELWERRQLQQRQIAAMFGISQATVWRIVHRSAWAHVA